MKYIDDIKNYKPCNDQEEKDKEVFLKYINEYENILERENEFAHVTSSSWITNEKRDKVLMIYHNIYKSWAWTGGHADGDFDLLKVAIKEAKEETGVKKIKILSEGIFSIDIVPVVGHYKNGKYVSRTSTFKYNISFGSK